MPTTLTLPAELTIYTAGEQRLQWLAWLDAVAAEDSAEVDAGAVLEADAAGVQLLLALQRALARQQRTLRLRRPSTALHDTCAALGLLSLLAEEAAAGGAAA